MRAPDRQGAGVQVWRCQLANLGGPQIATIASWLIHAPGHHAVWSWWMLGVIHLRDLPGVPPAVKADPSTTHEIISFALDPGLPVPDPDDLTAREIAALEPYDLVWQCALPSDRHAVQLVEGMISVILEGHASPDADYRQFWTETLTRTAEHMRTGGHP